VGIAEWNVNIGGAMANDVSLTPQEKRVAKALLAKKWRNQDIQALINIGRKATVNSGRITGVKKDQKLQPAKDDEVEFFLRKKKSYDQQTGLNRYEDERLIRSREAMILAVHVFNSAGLKFKTEVFCMLANVAWTYLMHEYYDRQKPKVKIVNDQGFTMPLSEMTARGDCPLKDGVKDNLKALKILRDEVEHHMLGKADQKWLGIFQACCLNYDKALCELFGDQLSLAHELSFALQFARMNMEQVTTLNKYEVPNQIEAVDALITQGMTEDQLNNLEFQFRVVFSMEAAKKGKANYEFANGEALDGIDPKHIVAKKVISDDDYPLRPSDVVKEVLKKTKKKFTQHTHQQAFRYFEVRPKKGAKDPGHTNKEFCAFHKVWKGYAYSPAWVEKVVAAVNDDATYAKITATKL
jgi:hypothetical protein